MEHKRDTSLEKDVQGGFIAYLSSNAETGLDMICQAIEYYAVGVKIASGNFSIAGKNLAEIKLAFETSQLNRSWTEYELKNIAEAIHSWVFSVDKYRGEIRIVYGYRIPLPDEVSIGGWDGITLKKVNL